MALFLKRQAGREPARRLQARALAAERQQAVAAQRRAGRLRNNMCDTFLSTSRCRLGSDRVEALLPGGGGTPSQREPRAPTIGRQCGATTPNGRVGSEVYFCASFLAQTKNARTKTSGLTHKAAVQISLV